MTPPKPHHHLVDHTGDIGLDVFAPTETELFEQAALGMFEIVADLQNVEPTHRFDFEVEASDRLGLMLAWLSELNFAFSTELVVFCRFQVRSVTKDRVAGSAWGSDIDLERHSIHTEIKAVTYHEMSIEQTPEGWRARIIFDL